MVAAAILPTTIWNGKLYFLFGQENQYETSAPGFSDFGGGCENNESPFQTALREGCEELTGFLGNAHDLKKQFQGKKYIIQVNDYYTYLLPIHYDPNLTIYFNNMQQLIHQKIPKKILIQSCIFEKKIIQWICIDDLLSMKSKMRSFYRPHLDVIYSQRHQIFPFVQQKLLKSKLKCKKKCKSKSKIHCFKKNMTKKNK
jgi:hypothetical protein